MRDIMNDSELQQKLSKIFIKRFNLDDVDVKESSIKTVEDWDSFTHMDLMLELESEFALDELSGEDFANLVSFKKILDYIKRVKGD